MNWLESLVHQHREVESPQSFYFWSGLCAISAIVKDNVYLDRGGLYKLYPNIYVVLHAESGLKKGPPINLAQQMVKTVNNTNLISGRASIQAILKRLSEAKSQPGGKIVNTASGFICASELSSSIVEDPAALTILTDLYDRNYRATEDWEQLLKMDTFKLKNPTVSLLGGINDAHAEDFFSNKDIQGGFLARTFIVYEKKANTINSLARRIQNPPVVEELCKHLSILSKASGQFRNFYDDSNNLTTVGKFYDDWYRNFTNEREQRKIKDDTGTLNRFGDSVLKIAMLISLARGPDLEITIEDLEKAIQMGEKLIGNVRQTTMNRKGHSPSSPLKAMIIKKLLSVEGNAISRAQLMKDMYMHYSDADEFDGIINSFYNAGLITIGNVGKQVIYQMRPEEVEVYEKLLKGKMK